MFKSHESDVSQIWKHMDKRSNMSDNYFVNTDCE